jgi:hypothetical protein
MEVVFMDRWNRVHEGTITELHKPDEYGNGWSASVNVPGDCGYFVALSRIAPKGTPRAAQYLASAQTLTIGTLVRVSGLPEGKTYGGLGNGDLGVVMADKGALVNVAKLGGHGNGYARLSHTALTVVDPASVLKG